MSESYSDTKAPAQGIEFLYSDSHLVFVNKPADLLSVPGRGPDKKDCVLRRVQHHWPTARVVHRLDCATSGVMVLALDADSQRELSRQFHDRETQKSYQALVSGLVSESSGSIDLPLMPDWPNRPRQMVHESGKAALTHYQVIAHEGVTTRLRLTPVTGRSHQLRVHLQALGHPIVGDRLYNAMDAHQSVASRMLLHAHVLSVQHPNTLTRLEVNAPVPF